MTEIISTLSPVFTSHSISASQLLSKYFQARNIYCPRHPVMFYIRCTCISAELLLLILDQGMATSQRMPSQTRDWSEQGIKTYSKLELTKHGNTVPRMGFFKDRGQLVDQNIFQIKDCIRNTAPWFHQEDGHILSSSRTQFTHPDSLEASRKI